ncbi:hypothetical protein TWF225_007270 [Orbilia oligospora]|nr:hypothetical protein TWF225_007270 [Orbilia oligospora]KAF3255394.1 hypothetical protein TWF217_006569 [Orbilia oligospora]
MNGVKIRRDSYQPAENVETMNASGPLLMQAHCIPFRQQTRRTSAARRLQVNSHEHSGKWAYDDSTTRERASAGSLKISFEKSGLSSVYMHMYMSYMRSEFDIARFRTNIF